jgi:hypothetical protein
LIPWMLACTSRFLIVLEPLKSYLLLFMVTPTPVSFNHKDADACPANGHNANLQFVG